MTVRTGMYLCADAVNALPDGKDRIFRDLALPGFGIRVYKSGAKVYFAEAAEPGGRKRISIGRHGIVSPETARRRAAAAIAQITRGGAAGCPHPGDPDLSPTVHDLACRYLAEHVELRCKRSTLNQYRRAIERHILPAIGCLALHSVSPRNASELQYTLRHTPSAANLAVSMLSRMFELAEDRGLVPAGANPCRFLRKHRVRRRERFLTDREFRRLGRTLCTMERDRAITAHAAAAIRLLMLTGCRRNEILSLRWRDVHLRTAEIRLSDSKTGPRTVPLSPAAVRLLAGLARIEGNPWVIPGARSGSHASSLFGAWSRVRTKAGLEDVRLHDLRHSFASRALALGENLPTIGKLLGHSRITTTARYAHLARDTVHEAAARVAADIGADILEPEALRCPQAVAPDVRP